MKAILYKKGGRAHAAVTEVPDPVCGDREVLIRVYAACICKPADFAHDGGYSVFGRYPLIPGHEYAGVVEAVGRDVVRCKVGDRVTADANLPCGTCYFCERGQFAFCERSEAYGQTKNGGFAQLVAVREDLVYKVPDGVSLRAASMTELVGCAFNCVERCGFDYTSDVLILGAGASGNILAQMVLHSSAGSVTVLDRVESKLARLAELGVQTVLASGDYAYEEELRARFPYGFDYIIDATADPPLISRSIYLLKKGGTFVNYSFQNNTAAAEKVELDPRFFTTRQVNYIGSTFQHDRFAQVLKAMAEGKVDPERIVTDVLPLEAFFDGMDRMRDDPDTIKVLLEPNGSSEGL